MALQVLLIEDDQRVRELVSYNLRKEGFEVQAVATGEEAFKVVEQDAPDLVILDLMLPGMDGLTVCRKLKGNPRTEAIPVVILTAKGEEVDIVSGLNVGADDYIAKPFSPKVLVARVRAVLRRAAPPAPPPLDEEEDATIHVHNVVIHTGRHEVLVDEQPVHLTATEFRLLCLLARRPGWVFSRQRILDALHGDSYATTERAVDVQMVGLRRKLGSAGAYIETVRGVGYRFKP